MGFYKAFFHVPLSVVLQPVVRWSSLYYLCHEKKVLPRKSSRPFVLSWFLKTPIQFQVTSMAQPGVVAAATISVLSMKYFLTVSCLRRRAPRPCGDPDPSRTIGRTSVEFSNHPATFLESEQTWRLFHSSTSSWFTFK